MEDAGEPSASSSNCPEDTAIKENVPVKRKLLKRFSYSSDDDDLEELEKGEEESEVDGIKDSSRKGLVQDRSSSLESEVPFKESAPDSLECNTASAPPKTSTSGSDGHSDQIVAHHWRDFLRVLKKGQVMAHKIHAKRAQTFPHAKKPTPRLTRRTIQRVREANPQSFDPLAGEFCYFKSSWKNFSLQELQAATNNFSQENLIGEGGYAEVYKGKFEDEQVVAVKRLTRGSPEEMTVDFLSELGIMVHVDHPNIARLIGYGVEGGMHLVLPLSAHGSLASLLYGPKEKLNWETRYKIALGTAEGLLYLHEECQRRIIHKDIKASNILLSEDFDPQISDFGLAKWLPEEWTHHTVEKIEGTFGYLPPEFFMHGIVDEKTDVYAFGVLLLELITGRQALNSSQQSLVMWAKPLLKTNSVKELVDPTIGDAYDMKRMDYLVLTAYMCVHQSPGLRPDMNQVVQILEGDENSLKAIKQQQESNHKTTNSEELIDSEGCNSAKSLTDLNQEVESSEGYISKDSPNYQLLQLIFDNSEI